MERKTVSDNYSNCLIDIHVYIFFYILTFISLSLFYVLYIYIYTNFLQSAGLKACK